MAVKKTTKKTTAKTTTTKAKSVKTAAPKTVEPKVEELSKADTPKVEPKETKRSSFIKLTRLDGHPIWINASFIITIEPRKGGGSVVVPIGDGLDYDVRNSPEAVIAMADGAPIPEVVPVPTTDMLPKPKRETAEEDEVGGQPAEADAVKVADAEKPAAAKPEAAEKPTEPEKPVETAKPAEPPAPTITVSAPPSAASAPTDEIKSLQPAVLDLTDEQVENLKKMMPKSVRKLANTLTKQFKVPDAMRTVQALEERGIISIDSQSHVSWMSVLTVEY